jgi:DHA2 family multidrug resistance protein
VAFLRYQFASNADYWTIALTYLAQGLVIPFFFVPTTQIALNAVLPQEMASAAGLSNFLRTTSAAFAASIVTTMWDQAANHNHADMAGALNGADAVQSTMRRGGMSAAQALAQLDNLAQGQAVMLATNQMFFAIAGVFLIAAFAVWLSPKPKIFPGAAAGGH